MKSYCPKTIKSTNKSIKKGGVLQIRKGKNNIQNQGTIILLMKRMKMKKTSNRKKTQVLRCQIYQVIINR